MGVQCYELFGGIVLKNHSFFILVLDIHFYLISRGNGLMNTNLNEVVKEEDRRSCVNMMVMMYSQATGGFGAVF